MIAVIMVNLYYIKHHQYILDLETPAKCYVRIQFRKMIFFILAYWSICKNYHGCWINWQVTLIDSLHAAIASSYIYLSNTDFLPRAPSFIWKTPIYILCFPRLSKKIPTEHISSRSMESWILIFLVHTATVFNHLLSNNFLYYCFFVYLKYQINNTYKN